MKTEKQIEEEVLNEKRMVSDDDLKEVAGGNFEDTPPDPCRDVVCDWNTTPIEIWERCCNRELLHR